MTYKCKYCGKEFDNPYKLGGHISRCIKNPNYEENCKKCNNFKNLKTSGSKNFEKLNAPQVCYCKYCNKECKNLNSLYQHECRCKENPNKIKCVGNKGNMPKHIKSWDNKHVVLRNGDELDITNVQLEQYRKEHLTCEICGKTLEESVKWDSKFAPKNLCTDHDHTTKKFRGLLCSVCNRQLGWFERNREAILKYLNKDKVINS